VLVRLTEPAVIVPESERLPVSLMVSEPPTVEEPTFVEEVSVTDTLPEPVVLAVMLEAFVSVIVMLPESVEEPKVKVPVEITLPVEA